MTLANLIRRPSLLARIGQCRLSSDSLYGDGREDGGLRQAESKLAGPARIGGAKGRAALCIGTATAGGHAVCDTDTCGRAMVQARHIWNDWQLGLWCQRSAQTSPINKAGDV